MAERRDPAVYSIPSHRAFSDALVAGLIARFGRDPLQLARGLVILPNARAVESVRNAFVRRAEAGLLLPRLVAIGEADLDEGIGAALDPADAPAIPPAIEPLQRQLMLARLLQQRAAIPAGEAMRLAADLAHTLDQLIIEEIAPRALADIELEDGLSSHWHDSLQLLRLVFEQWPEALAKQGRIDLTDRRNRLLRKLEIRWRATPPTGFVVAAGISTGARAIAELLRCIARIDQGLVVFAGLDQTMPDDEWDAIGAEAIESHPQFHLHQLLTRIGASRAEVETWRWGSEADARAPRSRTISNALAPAAFTDKWVGLPASERSLAGVHALELATAADEAQAIAIALRGALEAPGSVALVTPDRNLARRVVAHLQRWGITADDSAGIALSVTPVGGLLLDLAQAAAERFAPVALLALLKHPLIAGGGERLPWLDGVRALDLAMRGPRPAAGLAGVTHYLESDKKRERNLDFWAEVCALLSPLETAFASPFANLGSAVAALREAVARLAGDAAWVGPAGRAMADLITRLEADATLGPVEIEPSALPALLRDLFDAVNVRPPHGGHPRVFIWGLLEAKLQSAETMVLAGLNEGVWPALPAPDPWLAPAIRRSLGLPSLERRIGLSAHDLAGALGARQVLLTRARRDARAPMVKSRFWLRLETMCGALPTPPQRFDQWARLIDRGPEVARATRPAPRPARTERPDKVRVTEIDRLIADPYHFYARAILDLEPLDALDADPSQRWRGILVHDVLDDWATKDGYAPEALGPRFIEALANSGIHPMVQALWRPRFAQAAAWIAAQVSANREAGRVPLVSELSGTLNIAGIELTGRVDRIDRDGEGALTIIDYKTGQPPKTRQVVDGLALQLGLMGLMAERGGFRDVAGRATGFEYWSLARKSNEPYGYCESPAGDKGKKIAPDAFVGEIEHHFLRAVGQWLTGDEPFTARLAPDYCLSDYEQLMRLEEWQGRDDAA